jgi:hypothetical protein
MALRHLKHTNKQLSKLNNSLALAQEPDDYFMRSSLLAVSTDLEVIDRFLLTQIEILLFKDVVLLEGGVV